MKYDADGEPVLRVSIENIESNAGTLEVTGGSSINLITQGPPSTPLKTVWGTPKYAQDYSIYSGIWTYNIPIRKWLTYIDGSELLDPNDAPARAYSNQGALFIKSGTTIGNRTRVSSRRHARYQANRGMYYSSSVGLPDPTATGIRMWGLFNPVPDTDGFYFKLEDGVLYACQAYAGIERAEEITIPFDIDLSLGNIYDIQAMWRGVGNIHFFIGNPETGKIEHVHTLYNLNMLDQRVSVRTPALPLAQASENKDGTEVTMWVGCVDVSAEGGRDIQEQYASAVITDYLTASQAVVSAIRIPESINGIHNTRDVDLSRVTVATDKRCVVNIWITRDPTSITTTNGDADWTRTGLGSFVESVDIAQITAYDKTKMNLLSTFPVSANSSKELISPQQNLIQYFLIHGDYLIVETTGANPTVDCIIEWGEEV